MTRLQVGIVAGFVGLFLVIFFVFDTKPPNQKAIEKSRNLTAESTDIASLLGEAKANLSPEKSGEILMLEQKLEQTEEDSLKISGYEQLASFWFQADRPDLSGYYAEELALTVNTEESWAIAATTYTIGVQRSMDPKIRDFCTGRALKAYEYAISLNPENVQHKVNLAILFTENPPSDNPMKGVMMMRELGDKHPNDVLVLKSLARLALKTGQFEKAAARLEKAFSLDAKDADIACLLAETYAGLNNTSKTKEFETLCLQLTEIQN